MLGKGSVNHNSRQFKATNIDSERTELNISYCNTPIKTVYHELFDEALQRYNAKQKRADRCIDDYYEKIRTGKQEKLFYEVIFQVGNLQNMASKSEEGRLAAKVLPCRNQDERWNKEQKRLYHDLLAEADEVVYVSEEYSSDCVRKRNFYMVDKSMYCIGALLYEHSGTGQTVRYARQKGVRVINVAE